MNKSLPYLIGGLLVIALVLVFIAGSNTKKKRQFDGRITLKRQDKIPYGTYVAFQNLGSIFPKASIFVNRLEPGYWDSLSIHKENQALIIITRDFSANEDELNSLLRFVKNGNTVFISAKTISSDAEGYLKCTVGDLYVPTSYNAPSRDTMQLAIGPPSYPTRQNFRYPGVVYQSRFYKVNYETTDTLGSDELGDPNFIRLKAGAGNLFVHLSPLAFSNYFLLHKQNFEYYEKALSLVSPNIEKVAWDEYYLNKRFYDQNRDNRKGWFAVLLGMKNEEGKHPFRAAFWLLIGLLVVFVLMEMRRKQRYIPVITKPRNDSLDFVKTIGRLYYDRGDHKNLCRKMSAYFLEHVRQQYKLPTNDLSEDFIRNLHYKSGAGEDDIREIVTYIKYTEDSPQVNASDLRSFHKKLELFYSKA